MFHLFKNIQGKFEIAFVSLNGNYIVGSRQGYARRNGAYKAMLAVAIYFYCNEVYFQEDKIVYKVIVNCENKIEVTLTDKKPGKPYGVKEHQKLSIYLP